MVFGKTFFRKRYSLGRSLELFSLRISSRLFGGSKVVFESRKSRLLFVNFLFDGFTCRLGLVGLSF